MLRSGSKLKFRHCGFVLYVNKTHFLSSCHSKFKVIKNCCIISIYYYLICGHFLALTKTVEINSFFF